MKIPGRSKRVIQLKVEGRLAIGAVPSLHTLVGKVAVNRPVVVLVCMADVTDMDAHGMGELVATLTMLERQGGRMALIAPSARVRRLLSITRLDSVFTICHSEPEALVRLAPMTLAAALLRRTDDGSTPAAAVRLTLEPCRVQRRTGGEPDVPVVIARTSATVLEARKDHVSAAHEIAHRWAHLF